MEQYNSSGEGPIYQAGGGFYSPYTEPAWKKEKRKIRSAGNGIGLASLGYIGISLGLGIFYAIFIEILLPAASIESSVSESAEWLSTLVMYLLSLLIPFGIYALAAKMPLGIAIPFRKAKIGLTLGGACIGLGASVIASYVTSYIQIALEAVGIGITMPDMGTPETLPGIILYLITLVLAPAFVEEIIFRGIIMQSLRRFGDIFALIASAVIFGIFHLNLVQMPYCIILGLGIGYFVMRTGSLWVGVIIHFVNNLIASVFEFITPNVSEEVLTLINLAYNLFFVLLSVIALVLILGKYKDIFRFNPTPSALSGGKKVLYFITSPALIIAMIAAVIFTLPYIYLI